MPNTLPVHVKIGEVKVASQDEVLKATLGSCVGIAFFWKNKVGLAHCLLPETTGTLTPGAKYVNQAIQSLISLMKIPEECRKEVKVVATGGSNMTPAITSKFQVGQLNGEAALKHLKALGFTVSHSDFGGFEARQITVNSTNGEYEITKIKKINEAS